MISKRDSKPFQVKFPIGIEKTNKIDMQYQDEWHTCFGLIRDTINGPSNKPYGFDMMYDKVITVNAGSITRLIDENTLFVVDNVATEIFQNGNYSVERVYPEYNGEIVIGLSKKENINIPKLYFVNNGKILYYQLNYDSSTKKGYIPIKTLLPFNEGDYVWDREPADPSVTKHRLVLASKTKYGIDKQFKNFYELTFVEG